MRHRQQATPQICPCSEVNSKPSPSGSLRLATMYLCSNSNTSSNSKTNSHGCSISRCYRRRHSNSMLSNSISIPPLRLATCRIQTAADGPLLLLRDPNPLRTTTPFVEKLLRTRLLSLPLHSRAEPSRRVKCEVVQANPAESANLVRSRNLLIQTQLRCLPRAASIPTAGRSVVKTSAHKDRQAILIRL